MESVICFEVVKEGPNEMFPDFWGLSCARGRGDHNVQVRELLLRGGSLPPSVGRRNVGGNEGRGKMSGDGRMEKDGGALRGGG